jgi:hypothetical protein
MDGSTEQPQMTAGLDLGDKYSYLCLITQEDGEVMEEGRLRTTPQALKRRFASERPMRIAIEAGTHSPWASRVLEECGHEVLVANVLARPGSSMPTSVRPTRSTPRIWPDWPDPGSETALPAQTPGRRRPGPHGPNPLARGTGELPHATG